MIKSLLYPYGFVPYSLKFSSVYLPYLLVNFHLNHGLQRNHGYAVLFRDTKLVPSISVHFIRVICGGSIRDEKWYIPADFSTLNHERLQIAQYTKNTMDTFPLCEPAVFFMRIRTTARRCDAARACWPYRNKCWSRAFDFEMRKRAPTSPCRS